MSSERCITSGHDPNISMVDFNKISGMGLFKCKVVHNVTQQTKIPDFAQLFLSRTFQVFLLCFEVL